MECATIQFTVGQLVYAKLKGYPPWPAVITHFPRNRIARVIYFNSKKWLVLHLLVKFLFHIYLIFRFRSNLSFKKLTPYHAGKTIEQRYLRRNVGFTKAYNEMKIVLNKNEKNNAYKPQIKLQRLTAENIIKIKLSLKDGNQSKKNLRNGRTY